MITNILSVNNHFLSDISRAGNKAPVLAILYCVGALLLSACGGGGSSGGGGGGAPVSPFAGTYSGSETITLTNPLIAPITAEGGIRATIQNNGAFTIIDSDGFSVDGTMNGSTLSGSKTTSGVTFPDMPGVVCSQTISYNGTGSGNNISGTISGDVPCTFPGGTFEIGIQGTFSLDREATPAGSVRAVNPFESGGYSNTLENAVRNVIERH